MPSDAPSRTVGQKIDKIRSVLMDFACPVKGIASLTLIDGRNIHAIQRQRGVPPTWGKGIDYSTIQLYRKFTTRAPPAAERCDFVHISHVASFPTPVGDTALSAPRKPLEKERAPEPSSSLPVIIVLVSLFDIYWAFTTPAPERHLSWAKHASASAAITPPGT